MLLRWWKRFLDAFLLWLAMELSWTRGHKVSPSKFYWGDLKFWKIRDLGIWIDETLQHSVNGRVIWCHSLHNFRISQIHPHYRCFLCRSSIEWKYLEIQTWEKPPKQKKMQIWFQVLPRDWRFLTGLPNDSTELMSSHQITAGTVMTTN